MRDFQFAAFGLFAFYNTWLSLNYFSWLWGDMLIAVILKWLRRGGRGGGGRGSCRLNSCSNESVGRTLQRERLRRIWYFEYRRYRIPLERFLAISTIQFKLVFFKVVLTTQTNSIFSILYLYNMFIEFFLTLTKSNRLWKQPTQTTRHPRLITIMEISCYSSMPYRLIYAFIMVPCIH